MSSLHIDTNNAGTVGAWRKSRSYDEKRSATLSCDEDVAVTHMQNHFTTTAQDLYRGENTLICLLQGMQVIFSMTAAPFKFARWWLACYHQPAFVNVRFA
eukprot:m.162371 g.162371  ORF g.162371 m.162371 type:complete len:100 (-) comp18066_c1_seq3:622-921(-)